MSKVLEILNKYYGYDSFRKGQKEIIEEIIKGNDILAIMPTGGGKSLCYQIPALIMDGTTIVISPLISLMKDQVDGLKELGIQASYINSSLDAMETMAILEEVRNGEVKLLYIAPERLESSQFLQVASEIKIDFVAVDEAHCISQWGHDFRKSYKNISRFIRSLSKRPVVGGFTATATEEVKEDIIKLLELKNAKCFVTGFDRENLNINIIKGENKKTFILNYLEENKEQSGIIYTATRREADSLSEFLSSKGYSALPYHAGLSDDERAENQEKFVYDKVNIIVATNAFGMGIDKPNVRYVIHYNMPKNIESYYQEIGRAGRDGEESDCILLFSTADIQTQKYLIDISIENPLRKENEYKKLQNMIDFTYYNECLKKFILNYFGEEYNEKCNKCSNCNLGEELIDKTLDAQKVFSCVYRMKRGYGVNTVVDVLRGSKNKKIQESRLDELSTYGIMKDYSKDDLKTFINVLLSNGYGDMDGGEFAVVKLNDTSVKILKGQEKVLLRGFEKKNKEKLDNELFYILKELRREKAEEEKVPPYVVFGDGTLKEMSTRYPLNIEQFMDILGVGELKAEKYGNLFLNAIKTYVEKEKIEVNWQFKKVYKEEKKSKKTHVTSEKSNASSEGEKEKSHNITMNMLKEGTILEDVAVNRDLSISTIMQHIVKFREEEGEIDFPINFRFNINEDVEDKVLKVIDKIGYNKLKPIKEQLEDEVTYDHIKWVIFKNFIIK